MKRVQRKLHSSRGASMLLALLFLLVCLTVGAVVLTAAFGNAGRLERNRQEQQDYLAVSSAAQLVKEDIAGAQFSGAYEEVETKTSTQKKIGEDAQTGEPVYQIEHKTEIKYRDKDVPAVTKTGALLAKVSADLTKLYYKAVAEENPEAREKWDGTYPDTSHPEPMKYDLKFDTGDSAGENFPEVTGTLAVTTAAYDGNGNGRYAVTAVIRVEREGVVQYATTLTFPVTVERSSRVTQQGEEVESVTTEGDTTTTKYKPTLTEFKTTVIWGKPVITKGAQP